MLENINYKSNFQNEINNFILIEYYVLISYQ